MLAAFVSPLDRWMLATMDPPMPNIIPIPLSMLKIGAAILMAARESAPAPWPMKAPSVRFRITMDSIPISVGTNICRKSCPIGSFAKSIASLLSFNAIVQIYELNSQFYSLEVLIP